MVRLNTLALALLGGAAVATAFSLSMSGSINTNNAAAATRRDFLAKSAATAAVAASTALPKAAFADDDAADPYADYITTESGMKYLVTKEGDGAIPSGGQTVKAHYTGWLDGFESEKKFDSSRDRGRPFTFKVGAGQVIRGWYVLCCV